MKHIKFSPPIIAITLFVLMASIYSTNTQAAPTTDEVVGNGTPGSCTEAEFDSKLAIVQASGDGELSFNCGGPATIIFTSQKVIDSDLVIINGGGQIILSGGNTNRLFYVKPGGFELRNITLTNGYSGDGYGGAILAEQGTSVYIINSTIQNSRTNAGFAGGAILSFSTTTVIPTVSIESSIIQGNESTYAAVNTVGKLVVSDSLIQNNIGGGLSVGGPTIIANTNFEGNEAEYGGAFRTTDTAEVEVTGGQIVDNFASYAGGGIYNDGDLSLTDVTIADNSSPYGGGVYSDGDTFLNRDTLVGNTANRGGALYNGPCSSCRMLVRNTTITDNSASVGGGAAENEGRLIFQNATLWHNTFLPGNISIYNLPLAYLNFQETMMGGEVGDHCSGDPAAYSEFSLFEDDSCDWQSGNGNIVHPFLAISPLELHGGVTATMVPPADSPAIDAGQCHLSEDQRGVSRPQGAACDIGAVERYPGDDGYMIYLPIVVK